MPVYNKLVRDKILEIIKVNGQKPTHKILTADEYAVELTKKLVEEVEEYKIDVKNVLKELNVLSGEKVDRNNDTKVITNTIYENSMYTGCWYSNYKVGDIVSKGDELGTVKDYFGNILHTCIAKVDGIILYQVGSLSILKDGPMITYGEI